MAQYQADAVSDEAPLSGREVKALEANIRKTGVLAIWDTEDGWCYSWNTIPTESEEAHAGPFPSLAEMFQHAARAAREGAAQE